MTTLKEDLRPEIKGIPVGCKHDEVIPAIIGGTDEVEIWFNKTNIPIKKLEQMSKLIQAAYDLGFEHAGKVVLEIIKEA